MFILSNTTTAKDNDMKSNAENELDNLAGAKDDHPLRILPADGAEGDDEDQGRTSMLVSGGVYSSPETILVNPTNDYLSGKIDYLPPRPRRPFDNTVTDALNAIELFDDFIECFFMLKEPSDEVIEGASSALIYVLSELHEKDATLMGLLGGVIARFCQCIPEIAHMVDTSEMDRHAKLKPG